MEVIVILQFFEKIKFDRVVHVALSLSLKQNMQKVKNFLNFMLRKFYDQSIRI